MLDSLLLGQSEASPPTDLPHARFARLNKAGYQPMFIEQIKLDWEFVGMTVPLGLYL